MKTVQAKVVVLGYQGVGKTCIVVRYKDKECTHLASPTIGATFFTSYVNLDHTRVKLNIWDTAGQERFWSLAPMYYRNANAALLVFDITKQYTFTSVKRWVKELQTNVEEPMVLCIIGNKTDLTNREVEKAVAEEYAKSIGGYYYECSALLYQGIDELMLSTAAHLIELSMHPNCTTIKVYDTNDDLETNASSNIHIGLESENHSNSEKKKHLCC